MLSIIISRFSYLVSLHIYHPPLTPLLYALPHFNFPVFLLFVLAFSLLAKLKEIPSRLAAIWCRSRVSLAFAR